MPRRLIYQLDLLTPARRELYEQAARRNGKQLSAWLREVADAAASRLPVPEVPPVEALPPDPMEGCRHTAFKPTKLSWGGRRCGGCGELLSTGQKVG